MRVSSVYGAIGIVIPDFVFEEYRRIRFSSILIVRLMSRYPDIDPIVPVSPTELPAEWRHPTDALTVTDWWVVVDVRSLQVVNVYHDPPALIGLVHGYGRLRRQSQVIALGLSDSDIQVQRGRGRRQCGCRGQLGQRHLHSAAPAPVPDRLGVDPWRRDTGPKHWQHNGKATRTQAKGPEGQASFPR